VKYKDEVWKESFESTKFVLDGSVDRESGPVVERRRERRRKLRRRWWRRKGPPRQSLPGRSPRAYSLYWRRTEKKREAPVHCNNWNCRRICQERGWRGGRTKRCLE